MPFLILPGSQSRLAITPGDPREEGGKKSSARDDRHTRVEASPLPDSLRTLSNMEASSCNGISKVHLLESNEQEVGEGKYCHLVGVNKPTLPTIVLPP